MFYLCSTNGLVEHIFVLPMFCQCSTKGCVDEPAATLPQKMGPRHIQFGDAGCLGGGALKKRVPRCHTRRKTSILTETTLATRDHTLGKLAPEHHVIPIRVSPHIVFRDQAAPDPKLLRLMHSGTQNPCTYPPGGRDSETTRPGDSEF